MIPYSGLLFFYLLVLLLLPAIILGLLGKSLHDYGFFFSLAMLCVIYGQGGQLPQLALFWLWQLAIVCVFRRIRGKRFAPSLAVFFSLLPLILVKVGEVWGPLSFARLLGVSYMTFRAVEVLLDIDKGTAGAFSLFQWSYFLLFFPSVSSGPIDRFRRFREDIDRCPSPEEYLNLLRQGVWKLMGGAFSAIVLGGLVQRLWLDALPGRGFLPTLSYMYGYTLFLFFNFAGYSSMAIGTGYLLGVRVPENFDQPFLSLDMKDFWARWHISLSSWLRDYVYTRFVRDSLRKERFKNPRTASYLGYLLTMLTMGIWHGLAPRYLVYGAYHGGLMCLNEALDLHWKPFKKIKRKGKWSQVACVLVTFHLFAFGLLIFSGRLF